MHAEPKPSALSAEESAQLSEELRAKALNAETIGYKKSIDGPVTNEGIIVKIPDTPSGDLSVCGLKDFLIYELRKFIQGEITKEVSCASAAVLTMSRAPVHVHAATLEYYFILDNYGKMIINSGDKERVVPVGPGSVAILPPGAQHGMISIEPDDGTKDVKALLLFLPGLGPKDMQAFRDEEIIYSDSVVRAYDVKEGDPSQKEVHLPDRSGHQFFGDFKGFSYPIQPSLLERPLGYLIKSLGLTSVIASAQNPVARAIANQLFSEQAVIMNLPGSEAADRYKHIPLFDRPVYASSLGSATGASLASQHYTLGSNKIMSPTSRMEVDGFRYYFLITTGYGDVRLGGYTHSVQKDDLILAPAGVDYSICAGDNGMGVFKIAFPEPLKN